MAIEIPLRSVADYKFTSNIDSKVLSFRIRWNDRAEVWNLDIRTAEEVEIVSGLALLPNQCLTNGYKSTLLPPGNFYIMNLSGEEKPTFDSLSSLQILLYLTPEEEDEFRT